MTEVIQLKLSEQSVKIQRPHPLPHPLTSSILFTMYFEYSCFRFQKETPNSMSSKYRRPKRINPVWEGDLSGDLKRSQPTTPPPSSPLTPSQLSSFTNLSPLSPGTLNSSRLNINDSLFNAPPPPVLPRSPGQVIQGQEGTITRARGRPGCQRILLVAMVKENGRLGGYSEEEVSMYM